MGWHFWLLLNKFSLQRVDSNGNFLWGQTGVRVTLEEINQGLQQIVSDGSGGCVVTWKTISSVFYVNRINESGERLWSDSGKVLGISNYSSYGTKNYSGSRWKLLYRNRRIHIQGKREWRNSKKG